MDKATEKALADVLAELEPADMGECIDFIKQFRLEKRAERREEKAALKEQLEALTEKRAPRGSRKDSSDEPTRRRRKKKRKDRDAAE